MARQYFHHSLAELEKLVNDHKHSRAVLGDIREELTFRATDGAKALLRDVMALLTGEVEMPKRKRVDDTPDNQIPLIS